jgi:hypothetical protein
MTAQDVVASGSGAVARAVDPAILTLTAVELLTAVGIIAIIGRLTLTRADALRTLTRLDAERTLAGADDRILEGVR